MAEKDPKPEPTFGPPGPPGQPLPPSPSGEPPSLPPGECHEPGTTAWDTQARRYIQWLLWATEHPEEVSTEEATQAHMFLTYFEETDPERYNEILLEMVPQVGELDDAERSGTEQALLDYLRAPTSFSRDTAVNLVSERVETEERVTAEERVRYVDIQTKEGWYAASDNLVDSWVRSFLTYIGGMEAAGQLTWAQAEYLTENPTELYAEYIKEIGRRGGPTFEVAGIGGAEAMREVGRRPGDVVSTTIDAKIKELEDRLTTAATTGAETRGQVVTPLSEQETTQLKQEIGTLRQAQQRYFETEVLMERPQLERIMGYTPTEYLEEAWAPEKLKLWTAGKMPSVRPTPGAGAGPRRPRRL